jgi:MFS family permease
MACSLPGQSGAGAIPNTTMVAHWFIQQRGRAMGLVNAGGSVGQLLLIPLSMAIFLQTDWRTTYLILGGMLLVLGVPVAALALRNDPGDLGLLPDGDTVPTSTDQGLATPPPAPRQAPLEPPRWQGALASTPMWLLMSGFFVCGYTVALVSPISWPLPRTVCALPPRRPPWACSVAVTSSARSARYPTAWPQNPLALSTYYGPHLRLPAGCP